MATKVNFHLSAHIVGDADSAVLVGDFNNWDFEQGITLKKDKDGSLTTTVALEEGVYQYRYFLSDGRWENDDRANHYNFVSEYQVENCVVIVPATVAKAKAPAKPKATKAEVVVAKETPVKTPAKPKAAKAKAEAPAKVEEAPTPKPKKAAKKSSK